MQQSIPLFAREVSAATLSYRLGADNLYLYLHLSPLITSSPANRGSSKPYYRLFEPRIGQVLEYLTLTLLKRSADRYFCQQPCDQCNFGEFKSPDTPRRRGTVHSAEIVVIFADNYISFCPKRYTEGENIQEISIRWVLIAYVLESKFFDLNRISNRLYEELHWEKKWLI